MIRFTASSELIKALETNNTSLEYYGPAYGGESAGMDLYNASPMTYRPSNVARTLIPTGLRIIIPSGYVGLIAQRGSISKTNLLHQAGVIDPGYTGEIFVAAKSLLDYDEWDEIGPYSKLPYQLLILNCNNYFINISDSEYELITKANKRQTHSLGSTNDTPNTN
jgi:dUTPase